MSAEVGLRWVHPPPDTRGPRTIHLNTSASGGGVAEMLSAVTAHDRAHGTASGWGVLDAPPAFFAVTKALHHLFHGRGDPTRVGAGGPTYRAVLERAGAALEGAIQPTDTVVLHDPQTLGLSSWARDRAERVYWQCHIGSLHDPRGVKPVLWSFFADDLRAVWAVLVTDARYVLGAPAPAVRVVHPAISPTSPKNTPLTDAQVAGHLRATGIGGTTSGSTPAGRVWHGGPLPAGAPVVLQVARWDPLKGMQDVVGAVERLDGTAHVVLAGPDPAEVLDDPEGQEQLEIVLERYRALPARDRARVHVVALSYRDGNLNALRVNALQRRADVVVQRSLEEGFGLTVTEAMLKAKPVVGSRTGGIPSQITDGVNGLLVDPGDDDAFAAAVNRLVPDPGLRSSLGAAAARDVRARYLIDRLAGDYRSLAG